MEIIRLPVSPVRCVCCSERKGPPVAAQNTRKSPRHLVRCRASRPTATETEKFPFSYCSGPLDRHGGTRRLGWAPDGATNAVRLARRVETKRADSEEPRALNRPHPYPSEASVDRSWARQREGNAGFRSKPAARRSDDTGRKLRRDPTFNLIGHQRGPRMKCGWGFGAKLTGRNMRAHFTICAKRPADSGDLDCRGRSSKGKRGRPAGPRMLCGWRCGVRLGEPSYRGAFHCMLEVAEDLRGCAAIPPRGEGARNRRTTQRVQPHYFFAEAATYSRTVTRTEIFSHIAALALFPASAIVRISSFISAS